MLLEMFLGIVSVATKLLQNISVLWHIWFVLMLYWIVYKQSFQVHNLYSNRQFIVCTDLCNESRLKLKRVVIATFRGCKRVRVATYRFVRESRCILCCGNTGCSWISLLDAAQWNRSSGWDSLWCHNSDGLSSYYKQPYQLGSGGQFFCL